jgi:valyl-tRNA synthetase
MPTPLPIATTRPELLAGCVALFCHPDDARFSKLVGKKARVPLFNQEVPILADPAVDPEKGTGLMMVCTWGDQEDVEKWRAHQLETREILDKEGKLTALAGEFAGKKSKEARPEIVKKLEEAGVLTKREPRERTLAVHERCDTPAEFVKQPQWFVRLLDRKEDLLKRSRELKIFPEKMRVRLESWIENLKFDWCVSRQRFFGVPIPAWFCGKCNAPIFAREEDLPVDPTTSAPPVEECPSCGQAALGSSQIANGADSQKPNATSCFAKPDLDVLDTWFTSSMTPEIGASLAPERKQDLERYSLRPQGHDIIRTWLFYTMTKAELHWQRLPFENAMINGHGLDEQGRKISKRLGNFTDPQEEIAKFGADAFRFWAASATLGEDQRWDPAEVEKGRKTVTKLWNVARFSERFLAANCQKPTAKSQPALDRWLLSSLKKTIATATAELEEFAFSRAKEVIENFFWRDFCDFYLEATKHRLYDEKHPEHAAAVETLAFAFEKVLLLWAPFIPFVTEELWQRFFRAASKEKSIHRARWPEAAELPAADKEFEKEFATVIEAVAEIRRKKGEAGVSLGAEVEEMTLETPVQNFAAHRELLEKMGRIEELKVSS